MMLPAIGVEEYSQVGIQGANYVIHYMTTKFVLQRTGALGSLLTSFLLFCATRSFHMQKIRKPYVSNHK